MSDNDVLPNGPAGTDSEQMLAALFANMVLQQTNMAMMFLGQVPHPESGKTVTDLETAQMFIGMLEMLEAKTKGNLTKQEQGLLKQSLTAVRMAFVQAVEHPARPEEVPSPGKTSEASTPAAEPEKPTANSGAAAEAVAEAESSKKFSKKY
jgi:hypothetical protein